MRTRTIRTIAAAALAALLPALAPLPALAGEGNPAADDDRVFSASLETGYRVVDTEDEASRLFPYDPLEEGPVFGFDLLFLKPAFGALRLEGDYLAPDAWSAEAGYNRGADLAVSAGSRRSQQTLRHLAPVGSITSPARVTGSDESPGDEYRSIRQGTHAAVKVRAPGYPAHLVASGRIERREGDEQMRYAFRTCATSTCHVGSRSRPLDQETQSYSIGVDTHAGPLDLAYTRSGLTWRDDASDPVLAVGDMPPYVNGMPAGDYVHASNPDLRSFADTVRINTNLTNRGAIALYYRGGEEENESSGVTRSLRSAGAAANWRFSSDLLLSARYVYDEDRTDGISDEALGLRQDRNDDHAASDYRHLHSLRPEQTRNTAEIGAHFHPARGTDLNLKARYRALDRSFVMHLDDGAYSDSPVETRSTLVSAGVAHAFGPALKLDATLGQEWTDDPAFALENTRLTRFGLGGTWTPGQAVSFRLSYRGYRGANDAAEVLQQSYHALSEPDPSYERTTSGDAFLVAATWAPCRTFSLAASWNLADGAIEQDQLIGGDPDVPGFAFDSDTSWSGRTQVADLRATWVPAKRLTLTAAGMWIDSLESYEASFPEAAGLEELGAEEFTKLLATLRADVGIARGVGLTLAGFWARLDDEADDAGDGTSQGVLAALRLRW